MIKAFPRSIPAFLRLILLLAVMYLVLRIYLPWMFLPSNHLYINEMAPLLNRLKVSQLEHYHAYGEFPKSNRDVGLPPGNELQNSYLRRLDILPDNRIVLTMHEKLDDRRIIVILSPEVNTMHNLIWHCKSPNATDEYLEPFFENCSTTPEYVVAKQITERYAAKIKKARRWKPAEKEPEIDIDIDRIRKKAILESPTQNLGKQSHCEPVQPNSTKQARLLFGKEQTEILKFFADDIETIGKFSFELTNHRNSYASFNQMLFFENGSKLYSIDTSRAPLKAHNTNITIHPESRLYTGPEHLFIDQGNNKLTVLKICKKADPQPIASFDLPFHESFKISDLEIENNKVYLLASNQEKIAPKSIMSVNEIASDYRIIPLASHTFAGDAQNIAVENSAVFIANGAQGVIKLRYDQETITQEFKRPVRDFASDVLVLKDNVYIADRFAGVLALHIDGKPNESPINPTQNFAVKSLIRVDDKTFLIETNEPSFIYVYPEGPAKKIRYP